MKLLFFVSAFLVVQATAVSGQDDADNNKKVKIPPALKNLYATIQDQTERNLFLGDALFGNNNDNSSDKGKDLGQRCGRRNPCMSGLDCISPTGRAGWRLCLPTTCIQTAANEFNQLQPATGTTPFEDFIGNIFQGAGLPRTLLQDDNNNAAVHEIVNQTTVQLGADVMENNNYQHYLKRDVVEALTISLVQEDAHNPMAPLHDKLQECFQPFLGGGNLTTTTNNNDGERNLQSNRLIIMNGFFVEISAVLQFLYGWGTFDQQGTQTYTQDFCFGAGPTAGGGAGYLLQLVYNGPGGIRRSLEDTNTTQDDDDPSAWRQIPFPLLMADLDAALGPGIGITYSTLFFLLQNRLWFKFYIGAGGGLALGLCFTSVRFDV